MSRSQEEVWWQQNEELWDCLVELLVHFLRLQTPLPGGAGDVEQSRLEITESRVDENQFLQATYGCNRTSDWWL